MTDLEVAALALAAISVLFLVVLVVRRLGLAREGRRRLELEERLRPLALQLLDEDAPLPSFDLPAADAAMFAELLGRYGRRVRGDAQERLRLWFSGSGALHAASERLKSRQAWKRAAAAYALGDMGSPWAAEDLCAALDDPDAAVRAAAARSLGRLGSVQAVKPLLEASAAGTVPRLAAGQALLSIGPQALPALLALVGSSDPDERAAAIELVGLIGGAVDATPVIAELDDASAEVRAQAARALGRLGAGDAALRLRELLDDRIPFVRAAAAAALGEIGDEGAVADLRRLAVEDSFEPARAAAHALARIDPEEVRGGGSPFLDEAADMVAL